MAPLERFFKDIGIVLFTQGCVLGDKDSIFCERSVDQRRNIAMIQEEKSEIYYSK
jgi:hypothetical protein